jgi:hypothetical protein
MLGTILLILEGAEKAIPLGLVAVQEIQKLIALLTPAPNPDGTTPTQEEALAAVLAAIATWQSVKATADAEVAKVDAETPTPPVAPTDAGTGQ